MKKIFSMIGALLAGAMMFSCNEPVEEITFGTEISVSVTELTQFAKENAEAQTLEVTANGDWMAVAPAWLEISPRYGVAGTTTVSVKAADNYEKVLNEAGEVVEELGPQRSATIQFVGEKEAVAEVAVKQEGDPNKWDPAVPRPVTMQYFNEVAETGDGFTYVLTGKITEVVNTQYGNFYFEDETGTAYVYGLVTPDGKTQTQWAAAGLKVNDVITVMGARNEYGGSPQMTNAVYVSHEVGEASPIVDATIADFLAAEKSGIQYRISGVVTSIAKAEYGNIYIKDATGEVYVYGIGAKGEFETLGVEVGDIVTLISNRGEYNGTPQAANSVFEKKIDVTAVASVEAFLATPEDGTYYMLTGTVGTLKDGDLYGNFDLIDETGSVYVYGLLAGYKGAKKLFQETLANTGLKAGDTLTLIGKHSSYNGSAQVGDAFYFSHVAGEGGETPEEPEQPEEPEVATVTFAEITEAGDYKVEGATVVVTCGKGYLLYDGTAYAYVYVGSEPSYTVGQTFDVTGTVSYYYGMMQIAPSDLVEVESVEVTHPEAEEMDGADLDAYIAAPAYKYVKASGNLSVANYTNLSVEGSDNTFSVSYYTGDLSEVNGKDVTLYGYLAGSNTKNGYATMYLVKYEVNE